MTVRINSLRGFWIEKKGGLLGYGVNTSAEVYWMRGSIGYMSSGRFSNLLIVIKV
jgi:hypothetical protein